MVYVLIVGCNNSKLNIQENAVAVLKPDVFINENNKNEYCLKAFQMVNGEENEFMGFVSREFLSFRDLYEGKLGQVVKIYAESTNSYENSIAKERNGVCLLKIIQ
jgi:hypothetical protein